MTKSFEERRAAALAILNAFDWETMMDNYRALFSRILKDESLNAEQRKFFEECLQIANECPRPHTEHEAV